MSSVTEASYSVQVWLKIVGSSDLDRFTFIHLFILPLDL